MSCVSPPSRFKIGFFNVKMQNDLRNETGTILKSFLSFCKTFVGAGLFLTDG